MGVAADNPPQTRRATDVARAGRGSGSESETPASDQVWNLAGALSPVGAQAGRAAAERHKQLIEDIAQSILQSPQAGLELFNQELMRRVKENWFEVFQQADAMIKTALGLTVTEIAAGTLLAIPEPTGGAKAAAITLQLLLIYLAVEAAVTAGPEAIDHGTKWWTLVKSANGNFDKIWRAAQEFGQMVYYLVQAIGSVVGLARVSSGVGQMGKNALGKRQADAIGSWNAASSEVDSAASGTSPKPNDSPGVHVDSGDSATSELTSSQRERRKGKAGSGKGNLIAEHRFEILETEHRLRLESLEDGVELQLCTTCAGVRKDIDEVLSGTQEKGPSKAMRRRLTKLREKVVALEDAVKTKTMKHGEALAPLTQIAAHLRDLSTKLPSGNKLCVFCSFKGEIDYDLLAKQLGFEKTRMSTHGEPIYRNGKTFISPDADSHKGGIWKKATGSHENLKPAARDGTYNEDLTERIGK